MSLRATPPLPPIELMRRVVPLDADEGQAEVEYEESGLAIKRFIVSQLPDGWTWDGKRVLDFGCGAGRVLRHFFSEAERAEFWGSEIDDESLEWVGRHLAPRVRAIHHGEAPPIRAPSGHFDLIYALSVFTHITDEWSRWLVELHRLLAPDGLLIATFLGPGAIAALTNERWSDDRIGMNVTRCGTPWREGGPNAFLSSWWIRAHWGRAFDLVRLEPEGYDSGDPRLRQGFVVMRPKPVEVTTELLEAPEANEPREVSAARHNVRQLARELSRTRASLHGAREENRRLVRAMESARRHWRETAEWWEQVAESVVESRTWRATAPIRRLRSRVRDRLGRAR